MRIIIIHRWGANPQSDWYSWLKRELEKKGHSVFVPEMPNTDEPMIEEWVAHLKRVVGQLDAETCFVAHSIGCQSVLRFLEGEKYSGKVGNVVFVAGWFKLDNLEGEEVVAIAKPWMNTPIDFSLVRRRLNSLTVFLSNNEPYGFVQYNSDVYQKELGAMVVIEKDKGHFTEEDRVVEMPEVLREFD